MISGLAHVLIYVVLIGNSSVFSLPPQFESSFISDDESYNLSQLYDGSGAGGADLDAEPEVNFDLKKLVSIMTNILIIPFINSV